MPARRVAVVGAGTMGAGIAQTAATHGCEVRLVDVAPGAVERAIAGIRSRLDRHVEQGRMSAGERDAVMARLQPGELSDLAGIDFVVEAVVEDLDVKRRVFAELERSARDAKVLATNTSSLSVGDIGRDLADPGRVVGMHFFNPAPVMPLVEVVAGDRSDPKAVDLVAETARAWEKVPARVRDKPGFIVNRVARGSYVEAFRMLDERVGGPETIDGAMRRLGQFRMGPMQVADLIGLEVNLEVTRSVWEQWGRPNRFEPPRVQQELVGRGDHGQKTGRGVYDHSSSLPAASWTVDGGGFRMKPEVETAVDDFVRAAALCDEEAVTAAPPAERYAFARILGTVLNEAERTRSDGSATAEDIDVALQRGTNYPRGPVEWARGIGHARVARLLRALNAEAGDGRYEPAGDFASA